jgi:hypothetical protein
MPNSTFFSILCATVLVTLSMTTHAQLFDRGNGLIYDDVQDLTWTQNAGMFVGRWYDVTINGVLIQGAKTWAENLEYGGFDDWRLPTTTQFDDPTCSSDIRSAGDYMLFYEHRADCTGGEMELLTALYNPAYNPIFQNVNKMRYWTDTPYRDWVDPCIDYPAYDVPCNLPDDDGDRTDFYWQWGFKGFQDSGGQYNNIPFKTTLEGGNQRYAWAVRDGDVIASILPGDTNLDGHVNAADYLLLTQYVLGTRASPASDSDAFKAADMNNNLQLDAGDLVILSRTITGLI